MNKRRGIIAALCMAYAHVMDAQKKDKEADRQIETKYGVGDTAPTATLSVRQGPTGSMLALYMRDGHSLDVYYGGRSVRLTPEQIMTALEGK